VQVDTSLFISTV